MADILTISDELSAVNELLNTIGETAVNSLASGLGDASDALRTLRSVSRRIQTKGWSWNTDERLFLSPTATGEIIVPLNALSVDTMDEDERVDAVLRGPRLYDRGAHTYLFSRPLCCRVVSLLDFSELPEPARQFITISACRKFQANFVGSETLYRFTADDERMAWADLINDEADTEDGNLLYGNYDVGSILYR